MLKFLRQKRTIKILLWIVAVVVIVAFVLWGAPTRLGEKQGRPKYAGEIFGKKIPFDKFIETYQASRNQAIIIYGNEFQKYSQFINLQENAWDRLILLAVAQNENIKVTNEEVIKKIKSFPFFQKDGKFDLETYNLLLKYVFNVEPREFEEEIRQSLVIETLIQKSLGNIGVTEEELENAYAKENDTARVTYVLIKKDDFKNAVDVSQEKLKKFYQDKKENFRTPKQVDIEYIKVDFEGQKEKVSVSDEEIETYYTNNKKQFKKSDEEKEAKGQEKSDYKQLDEVKEEIKTIVLAQKTQEKALELAYEVSDFLYEGKSPKEVSEEFSLPLGKTGFFNATQSIPDIGWSYQFLVTAFKLEKDQISDIVQTPKGYYILKLIDKKEPYIPPLDEIKKKVTESFVNEKAKAKAKEKTQAILAVLEKEKNEESFDFSQATEALGLKNYSTEDFKKDAYIPNIGQSKEFTQEAFKLNEEQISQIIEVPNGYAILMVDERKPFDREKFTEEKESFKEKLLERKKQEYYIEWFKNLKQKANLKSNLSPEPETKE